MNARVSVSGVVDSDWRSLYKVGAWSAVAVLIFIPIQMVVFVVWPPPQSVADWFALFHESSIVGLLDMDLLLSVDYVLLGLVYLALCVALMRGNRSLAALALALELLSVAIYFASTAAFEMLALSGRYAAATTDAERGIFLAAGEAMVATWQGTAFNASYLLGAAAILIVSVIMMRSDVFGRGAAYSGIIAGVTMLLPPTVGIVGIVLSLVSLIPTALWLVFVARGLFRAGSDVADGRTS